MEISTKTTDVQTLVTQYLRYSERNLHYAEGTIKHRRVFLGQLTVYLIRNKLADVTEVTIYDIDDFLGERSDDVSLVTLNDVKRSVRMFSLWIEEYKGLPLKFSPQAIKDTKLYRKRVKPAERSDIYRAVKGANRQDKLMIVTMYESGMRLSELVNLKVEDIHGEEIHVTGKGDKDRLVYVTPELALELLMWFKMNGWTKGHAFRPLMHSDGESGYYHETARQRIKDCFKRVDVKMHPHQLRHAYAVRLMKNGTNMRTIQKLLGHSKLETTMQYLNVTDPWLHKEYRYRFGKSAMKR